MITPQKNVYKDMTAEQSCLNITKAIMQNSQGRGINL